jgi:hypothetical protein
MQRELFSDVAGEGRKGGGGGGSGKGREDVTTPGVLHYTLPSGHLPSRSSNLLSTICCELTNWSHLLSTLTKPALKIQQLALNHSHQLLTCSHVLKI